MNWGLGREGVEENFLELEVGEKSWMAAEIVHFNLWVTFANATEKACKRIWNAGIGVFNASKGKAHLDGRERVLEVQRVGICVNSAKLHHLQLR